MQESRIRTQPLLFGMGGGLLVWILIVAVTSLTTADGASPMRLLILLGGSLPSGVIQGLTFIAFGWAMAEIFTLNADVTQERIAFRTNLLPDDQEHLVLARDDVLQLRQEAIRTQQKHPSLLADLVRKLTTKFRANQAVPEVMGLLESQVQINLRRAESEQAVIRYLIWAIPSIGFVGTVIGIANSLGLANQAGTEEGMTAITSALNVAFDTTLVALILSLVVMYGYQMLQRRAENLHSDLEDYVTEHFVNRLQP